MGSARKKRLGDKHDTGGVRTHGEFSHEERNEENGNNQPSHRRGFGNPDRPYTALKYIDATRVRDLLNGLCDAVASAMKVRRN